MNATYYGKVFVGPDTLYVRFASKTARDNWVGRASRRNKVRSNSRELKSLTWEHDLCLVKG